MYQEEEELPIQQRVNEQPEQLFINALWFDDTPRKHHRERRICITIDDSDKETLIDG